MTLTLVLFADASRIDLRALRREYSCPLRLLGIGLPLTIAAGWAVGAGLFGSFSLAEVLILAVILAPTDAALGQEVVTDPRLPSRIRQGLNVESGSTTGSAFRCCSSRSRSPRPRRASETNHGAFVLVADAIGYGVLFGAIAGARRRPGRPVRPAPRPDGLARGARSCRSRRPALAYGLAAPLGGSGFIAAFVAGFAFGMLHRDTDGETTYLLGELGGLANSVTFLVFGAAIAGSVLAT